MATQPSATLSLPAVLRKTSDRLPVCPAVFGRLIELLGSADSTCDDLAKVIALDPILASEILRVVNSVRFAGGSSVTSVEHAVLRLGFQEVNAIALAMQAKGIFKGGQWTAFNSAIWKHSVRTAALCALMAARQRTGSADLLFTAGLLHDIGKLVLYAYDHAYEAWAHPEQLYGKGLVSEELARFRTEHSVVGAELLRGWRFSAQLVKLVETHHDLPPGAQPLFELLAHTDALAHQLPWEMGEHAEASHLAVDPALLSRMNLTPEMCCDLLRMATQRVELFGGH
ncbi:MAG: HDOD domain-containing protein [Planctomycetota bacterium]|nr:HDOD domain-containing protein [Planctomycetota bacterium]